MARHELAVAWVWTLAVLAIAAGPGGGPAPAPSLPTMPPGGLPMTLGELRALAASVGFPDPNMAAAIAMAESSGNPFAVGDAGTSFGLWQIHAPSHPEFDKSQLLSATFNAHAALLVSKSGTDWSPWSTFTSGAFKQFLGASA
jgi:hypothetical protein